MSSGSRHPGAARLSDMKSSAAILSVVLSMTVACNRSGSSGNPHQTPLVGASTGAVQIDLLADGNPVIYFQYAVIPQTGEVRVLSEARFNQGKEEIPDEFDQPTGAIDACWKKPASASPDAKYVARCVDEFDRRDQFSVVHHDAFIVEDRIRSAEAFHWKMEERRRIRGFAWSPKSDAVAVLSLRQDYVRLGFLGHMAIPYDAVYLDVIGVDHQFAEYMVRRDVVYAWSRILKWNPNVSVVALRNK